MSLVERGEFERRLLAEHKERQSRFFAPPRPENKVDQKVVELVPMVVKSPYEDVMDLMVAAVANVAGLPVNEIIEGPSVSEVVTARRLAMALSFVRCGIPMATIAKYFGVHVDCVRDSALELQPLWRLYTFSTKTPIERSLTNLWPLWLSERETVKYPAIRDIQKAVCETFSVMRVGLLSPRRTQELVTPRQIAMALCKHLTVRSLPEIGRQFGGRDHTTVLHSVRKYEPLIAIACETMTPRNHVLEWAKEAKRIYDSNLHIVRGVA
jgi:hypothetical protein